MDDAVIALDEPRQKESLALNLPARGGVPPRSRSNRFSTSAVTVSTYGFVSARTTPARTSIVACQGEPWITRKLVPSVAVVLASHSYAYAASSLITFGASAASVRGPSSDESV